MRWFASFPAFGQFTINFTAVVDSAPPGTQERNFTAAVATVGSPATPFRTISPSLPLKEGMRRQKNNDHLDFFPDAHAIRYSAAERPLTQCYAYILTFKFRPG